MGHYRSNLRDLEFNLFEVFGRAASVLGTAPFDELDATPPRSMLRRGGAAGQRRAGRRRFVDADRNPPVFDPATALGHLPESFKKSYQAYMDAEWWRLDLPAELGGTVAPRRACGGRVAELVLGANPAVYMYAGGPASPTSSTASAPPEQQQLGRADDRAPAGAPRWC